MSQRTVDTEGDSLFVLILMRDKFTSCWTKGTINMRRGGFVCVVDYSSTQGRRPPGDFTRSDLHLRVRLYLTSGPCLVPPRCPFVLKVPHFCLIPLCSGVPVLCPGPVSS